MLAKIEGDLRFEEKSRRSLQSRERDKMWKSVCVLQKLINMCYVVTCLAQVSSKYRGKLW